MLGLGLGLEESDADGATDVDGASLTDPDGDALTLADAVGVTLVALAVGVGDTEGPALAFANIA